MKPFLHSCVIVWSLAAALRAGAWAADAASLDSTPPLPYHRAQWKHKYVRPRAIPFPAGNLFTPTRELLGRTLFFDPRLSGSRTVACASCHNPGFSWSDASPERTALGANESARKTPTILNLAWADLLFWDGRAESLEEQALIPIASATEMNLPLEQMVAVLTRIPGYRPMFDRAYLDEGINSKTVARALATFERTLISGRAPFDEWVSGREAAISSAAKRGFDIFNTKGACQKCHSGWNFTDNGFHDTGVADADLGRGTVLPLPAMQHAFKTPTLRNLDRHPPYMHDGSEATLEDVIELYDLGGRAKRPSLAPEMVPLHLTAQEKADLLTFLKTLTSDDKPVHMPIFPH